MTEPDATFWKRKLAAYLHDPPEKSYDFGPAHQQRAQIHANNFGVGELWNHLTSHPDWSAASADRFIFPHGSKLGNSLGETPCPSFIHPISGRNDNGQPSLPDGNLQFPDQNLAESCLADTSPDWKSEDDQTKFLCAWRIWLKHAAEHQKGKGHGAELLPCLPADTRICDASIWHHNAVVSALEATRTDDNPSSKLRPAFLIFQIGPVQEFIAQARSTRDLWSGSYLLSWLTMHAIKAVADQLGPDAIIFPSLRGQPLYDFLETRLGLTPRHADVLVPGIPNRFLAIVPANFDVGNTVAAAFRQEWEAIAETCQKWLQDHGIPFHPPFSNLWKDQIQNHWQLSWQLWPWQSVNDALRAFAHIPLGKDNPIHLAKDIALAIPDDHKDRRCYRGGQLDPGWAWSAHYQLTQHRLDARRSVRNFNGMPTAPSRKPGHRDALSGREEAVLQADALETACAKDETLRHLFRHIEPLGAANLIKRVWHRAYLSNQKSLHRATEAFDSVPSVAAAGWIAHLRDRLNKNSDLWLDLITLSEKLFAAKPHLAGVTIPDPVSRSTSHSESKWLSRVEAEVFTTRFWNNLPEETAAQTEVRAAAQAIRSFKDQHKLGEPPAYYAVLALDGDQIGKWLSGEKSPAVENVISPKAAAYFRKHVKGPDVEKWLKSPRPISPSWHLQFSEALANFGLHAARRIVEDIHHGQLIYSGGDDVLAMLPADEAIACAINLRAAFQGRHAGMSPACQQLFRADAPEGFLWLASPEKGEPSWPLLVPGPRMTVSVGIAIGHVKEPLQDMIAEAQAAEKRAKAPAEKEVFDRDKNTTAWKLNEGWERDALALTLYKRSGETIRWGAKFDSAAFPLLQTFQQHYRTPWDRPETETPISGKFPYRLAELIHPYGETTPVTAEMHDIALREFEHVCSRQIQKTAAPAILTTLIPQAAAYLSELRDSAPTPRPLREFTSIFLTEAFIRRQAA